MANNNWLKANWLALSIFVAILALGVTWGVTQNQQKTNTDEIEKKVDKELFDLYMIQQVNQFESLDKTITTGFSRIDKRLERIENK